MKTYTETALNQHNLMNKYIHTLKLLLASIFLITTNVLQAQDQEEVEEVFESTPIQTQGAFRLGGGLVFGSKSGVENDLSSTKGTLGLNIGGEVLVRKEIGVAAGYSHFATTNIKFFGQEEIDIWVSMIDIDLRYYLITQSIPLYVFGGLSVFQATSRIFGIKEKDSETGFNLGAGTIIPFSSRVGLNLQMKYNKIPNDSQLVANAGIVVKIN